MKDGDEMFGNENAASDEGLLYDLTKLLECDYISSLREMQWQRALSKLLPYISVDRYPLEQWCEAVQYILGCDLTFSEAEAARNYLCEQLHTINSHV